MDGVLLSKYYLLATCCIISFLFAEVEVFKQFWAECQCVILLFCTSLALLEQHSVSNGFRDINVSGSRP